MFRKPITTLGGLFWWKIIRQNKYFVMQQHRTGPPIWPYPYRILMRSNRMEIANSNDVADIEHDWQYLEDERVPQLDKGIDIGELIIRILNRL